MIIGYLSYYFLLPPVATFIEGKSFTSNLYHPIEIMFHAFLNLTIIIITFILYQKTKILQKIRLFISHKIYYPIGMYVYPTNIQLFLMGIIGITAMAYINFIAGGYQVNISGIFNKLLIGYYPFAYLPYIILIKKIFVTNNKIKRTWFVIIIIYTILIAIISFARNSRYALFSGIASILLTYAWGIISGYYKLKKIDYFRLLFFMIIFVSSIGFISDLAMTMVIVRQQRKKITALELIMESIHTMQNPEIIHAYKNEPSQSWDENYVDNIFLARLCNLKYADNSIDLENKMGTIARGYIKNIEIQKIYAIFPRPLIEKLNLPTDKDLVENASMGDFMLFAINGDDTILGGFRTGSIFGIELTAWGWSYILIFGLLLLIIFPLSDSLTLQIKDKKQKENNISRTILSPIAIINLFGWFVFLTSAAGGSESFVNLINYILRGWIQLPFLYITLYWLINLFTKIFSPSYGK